MINELFEKYKHLLDEEEKILKELEKHGYELDGSDDNEIRFIKIIKRKGRKK